MARLKPILKALATATKRERQTFRSIATNNFFVTALLVMGEAGGFVFLLGALVVLFPLSADPLSKVPPERLALWPLDRRDRRLLRILSPWLNPITWGLAALAAWAIRHTESTSLFALAAVLFAVGFFVPGFSGEPAFLRWIPAPGGVFAQLVRKSLREMLLTLDFYLALLLSAAGAAYRLLIHPFPDEGRMVITLLIVLALSSYAQCLFGLESSDGMIRYKLMPVPGWRILAAKDAAFLGVAVLFTAPLSASTGCAAALAALAVGHASSLDENRKQTRWRFSSGASMGAGITQVLAITGAGVTAFRISSWILPACALVCAASAWWYGKKFK